MFCHELPKYYLTSTNAPKKISSADQPKLLPVARSDNVPRLRTKLRILTAADSSVAAARSSSSPASPPFHRRTVTGARAFDTHSQWPYEKCYDSVHSHRPREEGTYARTHARTCTRSAHASSEPRLSTRSSDRERLDVRQRCRNRFVEQGSANLRKGENNIE